MGDRPCSKCGNMIDGAHQSYCKACNAAYNKARRNLNKEDYNERQRQWSAANKEKRAEYRRRSHLKNVYGVSEEWFNGQLAAQNNACSICLEPFGTSKNSINVDHDHTTGEVRELLCQSCNLALGLMDDSQWKLSQMIAYVRRNKLQLVKERIS